MTIRLKYLSNFWRSLYLALMNSKTWFIVEKKNLLIEHHNNIACIGFKITSTKLYVPAVAFSIKENIKFLENIKEGFKTTISWNEYRAEITTQHKNNNLNYMTDTTCKNINWLFVLSFKKWRQWSWKRFFNKYYMPLVEIKNYNALLDNKLLFNRLVKNKQNHMKNMLECQKIMTVQQET